MTKGFLLVVPYQCFPPAEQHAVILSANCLHDLTCVLLRLHLPPAMQTHPGKGVTTFVPDNVATQPRKSASGSPRTLTTQQHGSTGGLRLALGNRRLMLEQAVSIGVDAQAFMSLHEGQARTCVLVGINGNVVAALAIADPLKPEARTVVAALQAQVGGAWGR
jgi:cation transport ATPase